MSLLREIKPKNARTARIVKARTEPQLNELRKRVLLLHGTKCPDPLRTILRTISSLTKPHSVTLHKKNENIHPFENVESLEFLAGKNDCGIVVFGSSSKKRPNATTICRMFDGKILDMIELLLLPPAEGQEQKDTPLQIGVEMKPMILFAGNIWDDTSVSQQARKIATLRSLLLDVFHGEETKTIDVEGLQYLMMAAASEPEDGQEPVIHLRWYKVRTKKSGQKLPRVEVDEIGPKFDFRVGRVKEADPDMWKEAMKRGRRPDEPKKRKNIDMDEMGDKVGRVHLGRQDLSGLQTRKMKGLRKVNDEFGDEDLEGAGVDEDMLDQEEDEEEEDRSSVDFDGVDFRDDDAPNDGPDLDSRDEMEVDDEPAGKPSKKAKLK